MEVTIEYYDKRGMPQYRTFIDQPEKAKEFIDEAIQQERRD